MTSLLFFVLKYQGLKVNLKEKVSTGHKCIIVKKNSYQPEFNSWIREATNRHLIKRFSFLNNGSSRFGLQRYFQDSSALMKKWMKKLVSKFISW